VAIPPAVNCRVHNPDINTLANVEKERALKVENANI
jgi:hypothetical protein